ncbi:unnamed protein product [Cochlearia groenlandica]
MDTAEDRRDLTEDLIEEIKKGFDCRWGLQKRTMDKADWLFIRIVPAYFLGLLGFILQSDLKRREDFKKLTADNILFPRKANSIRILSLADAIESAAISYESLSNSITERDGTRAFGFIP